MTKLGSHSPRLIRKRLFMPHDSNVIYCERIATFSSIGNWIAWRKFALCRLITIIVNRCLCGRPVVVVFAVYWLVFVRNSIAYRNQEYNGFVNTFVVQVPEVFFFPYHFVDFRSSLIPFDGLLFSRFVSSAFFFCVFFVHLLHKFRHCIYFSFSLSVWVNIVQTLRHSERLVFSVFFFFFVVVCDGAVRGDTKLAGGKHPTGEDIHRNVCT